MRATLLSASAALASAQDTDPIALITVVTHAGGLDLLMEDAKDRNCNPYESAI